MTDVERQGYRAFLSYSHRDSRWGKRLHRALESYRVDQDLIGRETSARAVPKTLRPIFRDREEFTAGRSLQGQSLAALNASQFLIVICSPAAAQSHYVNEEVRQFKALGRAAAIIPVIVGGEPGHAERECFPPALRFEVDADGNVTDRPSEVLAADVRDAADGWGLALAKVIAALLGLNTDDIYRRSERQRRRQQRIQFAIAAAVLVLLVVGGVFAWQSHQSQQQIAEIKALVAQYAPVSEGGDAAPGAEQSLTEAITSIAQGAVSDPRKRQALDLLEAGKPAEAVPLLKAVAEDKKKRAARQNREAAEDYRNLAAIAAVSDPASARQYYAEAAALDPDNVEGLFRHGWMQREAGNLQEAESAFRRVLDLGQQGKDDTWLYWARLGIGDVLVRRGDLPGAASEFEKAKDFAEQIAAQDPGNAGWQYDLGISHERIGDVLMARGNLDQALAAYERKHEIISGLTQQDPGNAGWQRDLSVSFNKIGDVQVARGDLERALQAYQDSLAIRDKLAAQDPGNAGWQYDLGISHERIGDVLMARGNLDQALAAYERKHEIISGLTQQDPGNAGWQRDLSVSFERIGDVQVARGDLDRALQAYQDSLAIRDKLAAQDPGNATWQRDLSVSFEKIGNVQVARGDLDRALQAYQDSLAIRDKLAAQDPGNATWQRDLSVSFEKIGNVQVARGDLDRALQAYQDSLAIADKLAAQDPGNATWQRDLWVSLRKLAQMAGTGVTWAQVLDKMEAMKARGVLLPTDEPFLEQARTLAAGD